MTNQPNDTPAAPEETPAQLKARLEREEFDALPEVVRMDKPAPQPAPEPAPVVEPEPEPAPVVEEPASEFETASSSSGETVMETIRGFERGSGAEEEAVAEGTVSDVTGQIAEADVEFLDRIEKAENEREHPRVGVMNAIERRRAALEEEK